MQKIPYFNRAPIETGAGNIFPYNEAMAKALTFEERYKSDDEDSDGLYRLYRKLAGGMMEIPRTCSRISKNDKRVLGSPIKVTSCFKPRNDEQKRVVDESTDLLKKGYNHLLSATTGFGKTVVGSEIAGRVGVTTLIVVTKSDIIDHWRDSLKMLFGLEDDDIGYIGGDVCKVVGKQFVIGMVQSLCKPNRYPKYVYQYFGLAIFDEVHRMGADVFSQAIWNFPTKLRLGLSATTDRRDGKDVVFKSHIGQVMVKTEYQTLIPKVIVRKSGWSVPNTKKKFKKGKSFIIKDVPIPHKSGRMMHIYKIMARSKTRNQVLCNFIVQAYDKGRSIVVFSDLKDAHLLPLRTMLISMGVPKTDIGIYAGVATKAAKEQRELEKVKPIVLTTYKMTSEATDVPWWDTAVLATPRSDVEQIAGRIRREYEGKKEPVIFDVRDGNSDVLSGYWYQRKTWYEKIGCELIRYDK